MDFARLPRILGAIVYDLFIVCAIVFVAAQWFPLVPETVQGKLIFNLLKQVYVLGICFLYFAYSWRKGGQTIGMKAWRIQLISDDHEQIKWRQCFIRFLVALLPWLAIGSGVLLMFSSLSIKTGWNLASTWLLFSLAFVFSTFSSQRGSLQDRLSRTRLVQLAKK